MDSRTLIAIVLSIFVIIAYQFFFVPPSPPPAPVQEAEQQPAETEKGGAPAREQTLPAVAKQDAPLQIASDTEIRVENDLYSAVLSSRGGTIKRWELKTYKDDEGKNVDLLRTPGGVAAVGMGSNEDFDLSRVNFSVSGRDLFLDAGNPSGEVVFEYSGEGYSLRRTYTFHAGTYRVDLEDQVSGLPDYWITIGSAFGIFSDEAAYTHVGPALLTGTDLEELKPKKLAEPQVFRERLQWIAQEDKYFFAALVPHTAVSEAKAWLHSGSAVIAFRGQGNEVNRFTLFAGPKDHELLASLNLGLEHVINFGFFSVIARPLFWVLKFFYGFLGNYGWAIVLLTIVTRIPFIPIMQKGQKSMKRLQSLQPKMAEIKEKYKKDPQKMQKEMTELYKKHKVNPVGGCLPMLLQIPVFLALYKVLIVAIELRGAPFMLWITDLSVKDPFYVLPIVMGITMFIQQKMTPSGMDPRQAKMMLLMPVVLTFLFLNFASGLVLYWLVNNILSIVQQFYTNRKPAKEQAPA